ncbi:MAG TPA: cbb3-type cytochrome c oxidase subunit I [Burkholderiaceae bacterium]|nr:cbb3-type cytochrome c oxidase subunit I [Burkholderiaceae bacterium]
MDAAAIFSHSIGRLGASSLPFYEMFHNPTTVNVVNGGIATFAAGCVVFGAVAAIALISYHHKWSELWEWLTSVDHKKIGIMYVVLALVMLARGLLEAGLMRGQQAWGLGGGFLTPGHFAELFSTHGTLMVFFMAMPFFVGVINYVMPLQIGARDVAYPTLNAVSLSLTAAGAGLLMISLVFGQFSTGGWFGYPPYTETAWQPGVGPDYWIWALTLSGIGSTMTGINFVVTILRKRAPGMRLMAMPLFSWTSLVTGIMLVFAMPPLSVAMGQLALDRYLGLHYFTNAMGGNMMSFANLFWLFGHPEVYILIMPAFGIYSEVIPAFSGKTLYGYKSMVFATACIAFASFLVWVHHFFTMGQGPDVNAVYGIASMLIGIPTGVKIYDWMATMFRGRVRFTTPMLFSIQFIFLFVIGGMTGILLANPTVDYQVHNTVFLVAHFHNVIIPGVLFGLVAGFEYWFPKVFGFRLNDRWGKASAWCWIIGFILAFFPLYALGLLGAPRRMVGYSQPAYVPYETVAFVGAVLLNIAFFLLLAQVWVSWKQRAENQVFAGDPWDGRSLEWATSAPPPEYNFPVVPVINSRDAFAVAKEAGLAYSTPQEFVDIEVPKNNALAVQIGAATFLLAFGLVWHIWWLVIAAAIATVVFMVRFGFVHHMTRVIPASVVEKETLLWLAHVREAKPVTRAEEFSPANVGVAALETGVNAAEAAGRRGASRLDLAPQAPRRS